MHAHTHTHTHTHTHARTHTHCYVQGLVFVQSLQVNTYVEDPSHPLVQAVCSLGGSNNRQEALHSLQRQGRLAVLRPYLQGMEEQVLDSLLKDVEMEVQRLSEKVDQNEQRITRLENQRRKELEAEKAVLDQYLIEWWNGWLDDLDDTVAGWRFVEGLVQWFIDTPG
jgi:hypothetical protein